jgi:DNA-binding XRE family transcriptional regulator
MAGKAKSSAPAARRKIRDARYAVGADRFMVTFDNGKEHSLPRAALAVDDSSELVSVQVDRRRLIFHVTQASGNRYTVPSERVLRGAEPGQPGVGAHKGPYNATRQVGARIRALREAKGLTQEKFARSVKMMRSNISRIEAGKHHPTLDTIERIAKALKVSLVELFAQP